MNKMIEILKVLIIVIMNLIYSMQAQSNRISGGATDQSNVQSNDVFKFIKTIQITPDTNYPNYKNGTLGYIHYIPKTDRFVVMIATFLEHSECGCDGKGVAFREYYSTMEPTGRSWIINCASADVTSEVFENYLYAVYMTAGPPSPTTGKMEWVGLRLEKYDPESWVKLGGVDIPLSEPDSTIYEADGGPTLSFVNGLIDVTAEYIIGGITNNPIGRGTHHHFFTTDLEPRGTMILIPPRYPSHCPEVSIVETLGGNIYLFASTSTFGNLCMLHFDSTWNCLDYKTFPLAGGFPTGVVNSGERWYVAYIDYSHATFMGDQAIRLAVFDNGWNILLDTAITTPAPHKRSDSPWAMLHDNYLYVSYVEYEGNDTGQAYVAIYDLTKNSTAIEPAHSAPKEFRLEQNYPNPFNPTTKIGYELPSKVRVHLVVYDILGREVSTLVDQVMPAGYHEVEFPASGLSSGIYFYKIQAGLYSFTKKMLLTK